MSAIALFPPIGDGPPFPDDPFGGLADQELRQWLEFYADCHAFHAGMAKALDGNNQNQKTKHLDSSRFYLALSAKIRETLVIRQIGRIADETFKQTQRRVPLCLN